MNMNNEQERIEQRLQNMKSFYIRFGKMLDDLPDAIPELIRIGLHEFFW